MPEGDTLRRTADGLRPYLVGRTITGASARRPGPQVGRLVGARVDAVEAVGKNLLIRFDNGLELRTHLRMRGSWHRYRPGEPWRRSAGRARLVLEVPEAIAVCFDAPVVELFEQRVEAVHRPIASLGPDILGGAFEGVGLDDALRRLRAPERRAAPIAEAIVDQRVVAGIGNIWKSESLWHERLDPFAPVEELSDDALRALLLRARSLMIPQLDRVRALPDRRSRPGGLSPFAVYRRTGRPCRRCGT
ncbi:MAG TPA: DNA-formamidopyrimidine glycosylase family protein, partial [Candidatus Limnocylindrales bacterium]|nr:DNA-formamidopyrimidine glycosylase family protein [Candidatus Limnocylindrales bacterium]